MGAFCVYGFSRSICLARAARKTPTFEIVGEERRYLTPVEWAVVRDQAAAQMFDQATKAEKISPEFDAPQFCRDWLAVNPAHVRDATIMVRGGKVDKNGNPVKRKGVQVFTWIPFASTPQGAAFAQKGEPD